MVENWKDEKIPPSKVTSTAAEKSEQNEQTLYKKRHDDKISPLRSKELQCYRIHISFPFTLLTTFLVFNF